jgi:hypothetical protein
MQEDEHIEERKKKKEEPEDEPIPVPPGEEPPAPIEDPPPALEKPPIDEGPKGPKKIVSQIPAGSGQKQF